MAQTWETDHLFPLLMETKANMQQVRDKAVDKFKVGISYKTIKTLKNLQALDVLNRRSVQDIWKLKYNTAANLPWDICPHKLSGQMSWLIQRRSQEGYGITGGATEIHSTNGRICWYNNLIADVEVWQQGSKKPPLQFYNHEGGPANMRKVVLCSYEANQLNKTLW